MTHLIIADPALEELRRQLRDGEITLHTYKHARTLLTEPPAPPCATPGCNREAYSVERGVYRCEVCATKARRA